MTNLDDLRPAIDAVAAGCRVARAVQQDLDRVRQITKDDRSPVTVADFAVQAIVAIALREAAGDVLIVGEEHAGVLRTSEHTAVVDAVVEAVRMYRPDATADQVLDAIDACDHVVDWLNSYRGHILDFYLLWMDRSELINDLAVQLTEPAEYRRQASGLR